MQRKAVKQLLTDAIGQQKIANVYMVYDKNYFNLIPLKLSEQLFLAVNEDDFILDGFRISRLRDIKKIHIKNDKCDEIVRNEGLFHSLHIPEINIESWQTEFESLREMGKNVIVEYETPDGENSDLTIGRIDRVYKSCLYIYHFDADGIWQTDPYRIPYTEVTSVTFDSRYVNVFSKYISPPPTD